MEVPALPAGDAHPPPVTYFPDFCYCHFSGKPCATFYDSHQDGHTTIPQAQYSCPRKAQLLGAHGPRSEGSWEQGLSGTQDTKATNFLYTRIGMSCPSWASVAQMSND